MNNCKTCQHAIFNALWGEYKCGIRKTVTYNANVDIPLVKDCKDYAKGTPTESKINAIYEEE